MSDREKIFEELKPYVPAEHKEDFNRLLLKLDNVKDDEIWMIIRSMGMFTAIQKNMLDSLPDVGEFAQTSKYIIEYSGKLEKSTQKLMEVSTGLIEENERIQRSSMELVEKYQRTISEMTETPDKLAALFEGCLKKYHTQGIVSNAVYLFGGVAITIIIFTYFNFGY
jgi:hypothetical protein